MQKLLSEKQSNLFQWKAQPARNPQYNGSNMSGQPLRFSLQDQGQRAGFSDRDIKNMQFNKTNSNAADSSVLATSFNFEMDKSMKNSKFQFEKSFKTSKAGTFSLNNQMKRGGFLQKNDASRLGMIQMKAGDASFKITSIQNDSIKSNQIQSSGLGKSNTPNYDVKIFDLSENGLYQKDTSYMDKQVAPQLEIGTKTIDMVNKSHNIVKVQLVSTEYDLNGSFLYHKCDEEPNSFADLQETCVQKMGKAGLLKRFVFEYQDEGKTVYIKSTVDLQNAYKIAKEKYHSNLKIRVSTQRSRFVQLAATIALWNFFKPMPAFALGALPPLAFQQSYSLTTTTSPLTMFAKFIAGALAFLFATAKISNKLMPVEPEKKVYGKWRTDVPAQEGYSHELIAMDSLKFAERGEMSLETLDREPYPGVNTMHNAFMRWVKETPNSRMLGTRIDGEYQWLTFKQAYEITENFGAAMNAMNLNSEVEAEGKSWKFFGIQSRNNKEWVMSKLGGSFFGMTTVALYDTLGEDALKFICDQCKLKTIVAEANLVSKILQRKQQDDEQKMKCLENIIVIGGKDSITSEMQTKAGEAGIKLYTWQEIVDIGAKLREDNGPHKIIEPKPDDVYMLSYTSGTTGVPKGVKITHKMVINAGQGINMRLSDHPLGGITNEDAYLSYLPLAHSFEQCCFVNVLTYGSRCGFYSGNLLQLVTDVQALKPTIFLSVPSFYNRIYGKIQSKFEKETGLKKWLIDQGVKTKLKNLREGRGFEHKLFDKLIFSKTREQMGGELRACVSGSAPISADVIDFLKICFISDVCNGYGMTEGCGASCAALMFDPRSGHVGGPCANTKIRLRDLPELGYMTTDNPRRGEICFQGSSISSSYFMNKEKSDEAFVDGWLLSGDVGEITEEGQMTIIDRAKNIFKLANGEYIAPEKIENVYIQSEWALQTWVYGDSLKDYTVLFVVVDPDQLTPYCEKNGLKMDDESIYENQEVKQAVYNSLMKLADENKLINQEKPRQIQLVKNQWTPDSGLLTPTMKMKRNVMRDHFQEHIDKLYSMNLMAKKK